MGAQECNYFVTRTHTMSGEEEEKDPEADLVLVTNDEECIADNALSALATVHNEEAAALLNSNEEGVRRFFENKGLESIGEKLAAEGVTGSNMHMMSARNIEKLGFTLGEQLALKNFVLRLRFIFRTQNCVDTVWDEEEFGVEHEDKWVEGICPITYAIFCTCGLEREACDAILDPICSTVCWCCQEPGDPEIHELPPSKYCLTNSSLQLITSRWADDFPDDEDREKTFGEPVCCFAGLVDPDPQYLTATDNIDLAAIEDVDTYEHSQKTRIKIPGFLDKCGGFNESVAQVPAEIVITYSDNGIDDVKRHKQAVLKVDPARLHEISGKILSARDGARARAISFD